MREMKLKIQIKGPVSEVFAYTVNPKNTSKWVDSVAIEETNEWPIKIGSIYRNKRKTGESLDFTVTALEDNKLFLLTQNNNNFYVKYSFISINPDLTELEYELGYEGKLKESLIQSLLDNLKKVMESE